MLTLTTSRYDGGEARFTCTHDRQEMEARVEAATRTTRDNLMWAVILLQAVIAPRGQADKAEEILTHIAGSMNFTQTWTQKQNNLSQQAAEAINRRMQNIFRQERAFIQKLNSVDESFESMDELISGASTYHDERTGNNYSLSNTNPNKWIDDNSGRIISTPTSNKPLWGPAYRRLAPVSSRPTATSRSAKAGTRSSLKNTNAAWMPASSKLWKAPRARRAPRGPRGHRRSTCRPGAHAPPRTRPRRHPTLQPKYPDRLRLARGQLPRLPPPPARP